ncbi:MAG: AzlC family ABC transporter permease [[Lactobacillus] timonensis]|jgi:4-azaleucine resistance transporter AzlC|uniref:AzlC family ABC transporter permease n=1 Tax=[Lactobacillus] timonensis TaxID=1970790 RepID=UPI002356D942|nr:AzlC family ABC transporter permease [[Lactobacillus] timonensis]MCI1925567.1 AzlC family ABC transporter permease [[Lactobacillus] timonensis]MCI1956925.1 AzlC family ABC transporter permease [[Lactobacillus] timonensis]MCI1969915.1 AzlC family ABC transporter permease [[Lactobacillus] timonensis]MCI2006116.1 AzlC family ABC transporter permease [[Lactobacillus] timonensis]
MSNEAQFAFKKTVPIMLGFLFLGVSYGVYMHKLGFSFLYPLCMAAIIFAGSVEFIIGNLLLQHFQPLTVLILTLLVNSRHIFYGITMLKKYSNSGRLKPFLIYGMCDESFSLNATLKVPVNLDKNYVYFYVTIFNYCSWVLGAGLGGLFGSLVQLNVQGLDFVMTALFIVLFTEQLKSVHSRQNAFIGLLMSVISLVVCGPDTFLLITLLLLLLIFTISYFWKKGMVNNDN